MGPYRKKRKRKFWTLGIALALAVIVTAGALAFCFLLNQFRVDVILLGMREVTLEQGSQYVEPGADALISGSLLMRTGRPLAVEITGSVDTQRVGTYTLRYRAHCRGWSQEVTRTVHVVDTTAPWIILRHDPATYVEPGGEYFEEGYSARDSCDGDLTDRVVRTQRGNTITYYVEDLSGNSAQVTRELACYDPVPPELTLAGEATLSLTAGGSYEEPGYTAWDNLDGDLTAQVRISGSVDAGKPGTYVLTYSVTDSYDHTVTAQRTVVVKEKPKPKPQESPEVQAPAQSGEPQDKPQVKPQTGTVNPEGKVIYLTFDDGPGKHTRRLLEVLAKYNVKATFFLVDTKYIDIAKEIVDQGHAVGIHSVCHDYDTIYASEDAFFSDLYAMQTIIREKTGVETYLMRFPGGSSNRVSKFNPGIMSRLTGAVVERGFRYFDWNVSSGDAGDTKKTEKVAENVINGVQKRRISVVLQHDIKGFSVDAVEQIIIWGLENGYTFLPLDMTSPTAQHSVRN